MASVTNATLLGPSKIIKSRSKAVKPILKKTSHSEKNSLDLDRGWEDAIHYGNHGWGASGGAGAGKSRAGDSFYGGARSARDVSFSLSATDLNGGGNSSAFGPRKYGHTRSTSGTSHISIATSSSGHLGGRNSSFVHPFQQTPRTSTPPLSMSYANSLASFDISNGRDYSPTITEDDDDMDPPLGYPQRSYHPSSSHTNSAAPVVVYPSSLRRGSLASQRTNSQSDLTSPPPLRVNTSHRSGTARLGQGLTSSRSDLRLDAISSSLDSPASSIQTAIGGPSLVSPPIQSPSSSIAPSLSPIRSSLETNFRIRSRSEVDTAVRQAQIRAARRQFEDKEALKEALREKKAAKRRDAEVEKEAQKMARKQKALVKAQSSGGLASGRNSLSADAAITRPSYSRKTTATTAHTATSDTPENEKLTFAASGYDTAEQGATPSADAVRFERAQPKRMTTAKRKTASAWTSLILWLRTKLLRAGKR